MLAFTPPCNPARECAHRERSSPPALNGHRSVKLSIPPRAASERDAECAQRTLALRLHACARVRLRVGGGAFSFAECNPMMTMMTRRNAVAHVRYRTDGKLDTDLAPRGMPNGWLIGLIGNGCVTSAGVSNDAIDGRCPLEK